MQMPIFNSLRPIIKKPKRDSAAYCIKKSIEAQDPFLNREYHYLASLAREKQDLGSALKYYKLACNEDPDDIRSHFQLYTTSEQYYKDSKTILDCYESFMKKFNGQDEYLSSIAAKRIRKFKEDIHFGKK
ncbi:hypothetical protein [Costertonia aggregata]|uniref:Tetratricopeptide repeat protein n=1 Tax=Costertonia aggregata TaxID=343403 RepID=A0A7H9AMQ1_9FLAO|nr:hypothetical protein [Costertonia aggregata]QLG44664.1 hypothetical protein HYG79_04650 [Costertonia aggregata]